MVWGSSALVGVGEMDQGAVYSGPKLLSLIQRFLGLNLEIQLPPRYLQGNLVPHVTKTVSSIPH